MYKKLVPVLILALIVVPCLSLNSINLFATNDIKINSEIIKKSEVKDIQKNVEVSKTPITPIPKVEEKTKDVTPVEQKVSNIAQPETKTDNSILKVANNRDIQVATNVEAFKNIHINLPKDLEISKKKNGNDKDDKRAVDINNIDTKVITEADKKVTFEFGIATEHLIFGSPVKVEIPTTLPNESKVNIQVKHLGDQDFNYSGLTNSSQNQCNKDGSVEAGSNEIDFKVTNSTITFYTCGASIFSVSSSAGSAVITFPVSGTNVSTKYPVISGTGTSEGATINLTLNPTLTNPTPSSLGTATVTNGLWSIVPITPLPIGSNTICINGAYPCTSFNVLNCTISATLNQASGQADPSNSPSNNTSVKFVATFSSPINPASFTTDDIIFSGTANGQKTTSITQLTPNNNTTFEITTTVTGNGTIIAQIGGETDSFSSSTLGTTGVYPNDLVVDPMGNVYTSNWGDNNVTKTTPDGISSIFGTTGNNPREIIIDPFGNIYTANYYSHNISKITSDGVSSIFGTTGQYPRGLVIDSQGNIYAASYDNNVTKITPAGISSIIGTTGLYPSDLALDSQGNIYTANNGDDTITKITPAGVSSVFANIGQRGPNAIVIDSNDNLYVSSDYTTTLAKITPQGVVNIFGSTGIHAYTMTIDMHGNIYTANYGSNNITKTTPEGVSTILEKTINQPFGIALDKAQNLYVNSETDKTVIKLTRTSNYPVVTTAGCNNLASTSSDNSVTNTVAQSLGTSVATIDKPITGVRGQVAPTIKLTGNTVTSGTTATFTPAGSSTPIVGTIRLGDFVPNSGQIIPFDATLDPQIGVLSSPGITSINVPTDFARPGSIVGACNFGVTINQSSNQADPTINNVIKYTATFASPIRANSFTASDMTIGGSATGVSITNITELAPNNGTTFEITLTTTTSGTIILTIPDGSYSYSSNVIANNGIYPYGIAFDSHDNVYIANYSSHNVTKVTPEGVQSIFGGYIFKADGIAIDAQDNVFVSDYQFSIFKITPDGTTTFFATTQNRPNFIKFDSQGNLYSANAGGNSVSKISPAGVVTNIPTTGNYPYDLVIDSQDNVYTANGNSNNVTKITPDEVATTFGTTGITPLYIAIDKLNNIYTANANSNDVTKITPDGVSTIIGDNINSPYGITTDSANNVYVLSSNSNTVTKITPDGINSIIADNVGNYGSYLIADKYDNLYVSNYDHQVVKITTNFVAGITTASGCRNKASTSADNTVTYNLPSLGTPAFTTANAISGITGTLFPLIALTNNSLPNGAITTFIPAGSTSIVTGTIEAGNFYPSAGQLIPSDALTDMQNGVLRSFGAPDVNIPTNFTSPFQQLTVTINQQAGQADPVTVGSNVKFTAVFNQPIDVSSFDISDILTTGSSATDISIISVNQITPNNGTTFEIVATATSAGAIVLSVVEGGFEYVKSVLANTSSYPWRIKVDKNGNVYSLEYSGTLSTLTKTTQAGIKITYNLTGTYAWDFDFDSQGNIFVLNVYDSALNNIPNITKIEPSGLISSFVTLTPGAFTPGMVIDTFDNMYITSYYENKVIKVTPGRVVTNFSTTDAGPYDIIIDPSNNLYTNNELSVSKITPTGVSTLLASKNSGSTGITIDSKGNIFAAAYRTDSVTKITASGLSSNFATFNSGDFPFYLNADDEDNIFVANSYASGNIVKISPSGIKTIIADNLGDPYDVAIDLLGNLYTNNTDYYNINEVIKLTKTLTTGVKTALNKSNKASTSIDNSVTLNIAPPINLSSLDTDSDGAIDMVENAGPNAGDGNGDGIKDVTQASVISIKDAVTGKYIIIAIDPSSPCQSIQNISTSTEEQNSKLDSEYDYPAGLLSFISACPTSLKLKTYWYGLDITKNYINRKFTTSNQIYDITNGIIQNTETINGQSIVSFAYSITDNDSLDEDKTIGNIKDLIGPALISSLYTIQPNKTINSLIRTGGIESNRSALLVLIKLSVSLVLALAIVPKREKSVNKLV
ncbi:MAG: hypothetical protein H7196_01120 [candidate division SR1 bacterium]|nr:hypothetical protein [candidate division SR1 bacterium]